MDEYRTHKQCAAVTIHLFATIVPPQKCPPDLSEAIHGQPFCMDGLPPTILLTDGKPDLTPHENTELKRLLLD